MRSRDEELDREPPAIVRNHAQDENQGKRQVRGNQMFMRFSGSMARPRFELGTPRFSGAPKAAEKPADLQDVSE
jgi:hypothetical protein